MFNRDCFIAIWKTNPILFPQSMNLWGLNMWKKYFPYMRNQCLPSTSSHPNFTYLKSKKVKGQKSPVFFPSLYLCTWEIHRWILGGVRRGAPRTQISSLPVDFWEKQMENRVAIKIYQNETTSRIHHNISKDLT